MLDENLKNSLDLVARIKTQFDFQLMIIEQIYYNMVKVRVAKLHHP